MISRDERRERGASHNVSTREELRQKNFTSFLVKRCHRIFRGVHETRRIEKNNLLQLGSILLGEVFAFLDV